ncbi:hypothetical protein F4823DRAFT_635728 [Ustulina deusta]|nr:hypothetical protein F4823DRAFT_635728 [Ustulina deusta]
MLLDAGTQKPFHDFVSIEAFKAVIWLGFGLMTLSFMVRAYIRITCFRKLFAEDWMMLFALFLYLNIAILSTICIRSIYNLAHLADGTFIPGPTFEADISYGFHIFAGISVLVYIGLWIIKVNFLVFFYRLGHQLPRFRIFWWVVLCIVIATGIAETVVVVFKCSVADSITLPACSTTASNALDTRLRFILSITLDVLTDVLLIIFPVSILWTSRICIRNKLILSGIFLLIGATIAIAIVRGVFSVDLIHQTAWAQLIISYLFFNALEYLVSFIVACTISFRSLFTQRRNKADYAAEQQAQRFYAPLQNRGRDGGGSSGKMQGLYDTILDTCRTLEGADIEGENWALPVPPSGPAG